ncbi:helix-turn-helix transcriptional regulator [Staphylococcus arlettae]|uniref:helix-turn-helix transcriptional regulator n=1 Tax=Staphylococcus arlettae TaxID=29378 RepID=UPI0021D2A547|nr:helix-turn-helix transcriptional regulator [Staphylococcus arlettae]UXU53172.1 helix-turn-helix transcriptional regulator [Staphylococcus arlettae]
MQMTLKAWRVQKGFTQKQLAHCINVSEPTYISWEKDNMKISIGSIKKIADALDITPSDIIFFTEKSKFNLGFEEVSQ